ncbi:hypothetical protein CFR71_01660 [Novacetimonas pomaceti]|uniref:Uncharacterized protein n=1 Tax=Novacetimonas pomaceti TaxID=2021998 RepID=A0A318QIS4_9PROT|nr:hypothetical protein CFR71_01660 [Novacetimonas pomaceti]
MACACPLTTAHAQFAAPRSSPGKPVAPASPPIHDQASPDSVSGPPAHRHRKPNEQPGHSPSGQPPTGQEPATGDQPGTRPASPPQ